MGDDERWTTEFKIIGKWGSGIESEEREEGNRERSAWERWCGEGGVGEDGGDGEIEAKSREMSMAGPTDTAQNCDPPGR
jgi:hypothetical protein